MRALIFFQLVAISISNFLASAVHSEAAKFGVAGYASSVQGKTHLNVDNPSHAITSEGYSLDASSGTIKNKYRYRGAINFLQRDVRNYLIRNGQGEEHPLSVEFDGRETQGKLGGDFLWHGFTLSVDRQQTMNNSPLASTIYQVGINYQSFRYGAIWGHKFVSSQEHRPVGYVVVPETLRSRALNTIAQRKKHVLFWEQIASEWLKMRTEIHWQEVSDDRPWHYGGKIGGIISINSAMAILVQLEHIAEEQNQARPPADGSGFYQLTSYQFGVSYELNYNLLLKAGVATTIETETARGSTPKQLIGTDAVMIGIDGRYRRWLWNCALVAEVSNTGRQGRVIQGGWQWEI